MPQVYAWRLASSKHRDSALSGLGSALAGGRWNPLGTKVVYCAASLALAVLEVRVHLPVASHPPKQRFVGIELGIAKDAIELVPDHRLPPGWRVAPKSSTENTAARRFGQRWVEEARSVALRLPSAVIPSEWIYLLCKRHRGPGGIGLAGSCGYFQSWHTLRVK